MTMTNGRGKPTDGGVNATTTNVLAGALVVSATAFTDSDGSERIVFCFPNLYVRIPGVYRIKFQLADIR